MRRATLLTTTLAMTTALAGAGAASAAEPAAVPTVESTSERVLQSVEVSMGPDGTTTGVGSSVVRTEGGVEDAETSEETYAPQDVLGDLPVRVLTAWRTADGAGTDLADLQGYTGRIAIDLTVQNLTVKPEMLTYDAAGSSHQQAALVGSPLTVTASTALGDLKAERVVTDHEGSGVNVTNGVLSEGAEGTTVQWAALLAPPVLSSSTEMSLVVDAKDFDVPTFDLSVQPGLVTDPSIGALVDSAFNPANSDELDLQRRTIELITDVNVVLARASDTISDVRTSLTDSAATLGTQTVADLQSSTQTVASNMSALDGALQSLRGELSSTLETTGSSAIAEMQSAVQTVDKMLGDTSAQPPTAEVRGDGCETTVADPKRAGTVYGSLLQVAGQLDGYAKATDLCKAAVKQSILDNIGPENPSAEECSGGNTSVTCSLQGAQETFADITQQLRAETNGALDKLSLDSYNRARTAMDGIKAAVQSIKEITNNIDRGRIGLVGAMNRAVYGEKGIADDNQPGTLETALARIDALQTQLDAVNTNAATLKDRLALMAGQTQAVRDEVCDLVKTQTMTEDQAKEILRYLVPTSCDGSTIDAVPDLDKDGVPDTGAVVALEAQQGATSELGKIVTAGAASASALQQARSSVDEAYTDLKAALEGRFGPGREALKDLIAELTAAFKSLDAQQNAFDKAFAELQRNYEDVVGIRTTINGLIDDAEKIIGERLEENTRQVSQAGVTASDELGTMLERSASGLSSSADAVVQNGRRSLEGQKRDFAQAQEQAGNRVSDTIEKGLSQIDSGVSSSTRDMEAASTLLIADLRKVLLDLGEREEGGGGLLGAMATNAATARTADFQLARAGAKATSYGNVRGSDIDGLMLRQAQTDAAMQMLIDLPAFQLDLPSGSQHRTVYSFSIGDNG